MSPAPDPEAARRLLLAQRVGFWVLFGAVALFTVWPWIGGASRPQRTLVVYGFSVLGEVMNEGIFPAFRREWETRTGERLEVISSFAGSGTVTNQIVMGVPAQVALLSLEPDAERLAAAGRVSPGAWRRLPHRGVVNRTPFVILVRSGNPKGIRSLEDLARPGVGVVHPDPLTSGGAQWALLAEYGAPLRASGDPDRAYASLLGTWRNVVAQASSARGARTQFDSGFGDALVTYEQEAILDRMRGELRGEVVYPPRTILSEHVVVVVDANVEEADRVLVDAFVAFLWSDEAQRNFVDYGFRSVDESLNASAPHFGVIPDAFTVADLGGWGHARAHIVDGLWRERVLREVARKEGEAPEDVARRARSPRERAR